MNIKQHIRMTASEMAMGRYMRAPDHPTANEFDNAFSEEVLKDAATSGAGAPPAADPPAADPPAADPPAADPPAADPPAADPPAADPPADPPAADPPAADPPADPPAADPPADPPAAAPVDAEAILNRLVDAVGKAKVDPPAADPPADDAPPIFNEQETLQVAKFREEWPEEAKAIDLMQRELGVSLTKYIFAQIAPEVKQINELVNTLALRAHHSDLSEVVGEYPSDEEIDKIKAWVGTQPGYLQSGMNNVIDSGTPEEIGDLVGRYREATGTKPAATPAPDPKPQGGVTELSAEAKQAAEALAPVGTKRSVVQSPEDTSNFDAAWATYKDTVV